MSQPKPEYSQFKIEIKEVLSRVKIVYAQTEEKAVDMVTWQYKEGSHILDSSDFAYYEITALNTKEGA
jgi:hypothetical protein